MIQLKAAVRLKAAAKDVKATQALVTTKLSHYQKAVRDMESEKNNPSVRDTYYKCVGMRDALEAVNQSLKGNPKELNFL